MSSYILSNANRFYVALESAYGQAAAVTAENRYPAVQLVAQQVLEASKRRDKTGSRTFLGTPSTARRSTAFETHTYLTSWSTEAPSYGSLVPGRPGCGAHIQQRTDRAASIQSDAISNHDTSRIDSGIRCSWNNEIRFARAIQDPLTISLNAPFGSLLIPGAALAPAITYALGTHLPSLTLYDYWI